MYSVLRQHAPRLVGLRLIYRDFWSLCEATRLEFGRLDIQINDALGVKLQSGFVRTMSS